MMKHGRQGFKFMLDIECYDPEISVKNFILNEAINGRLIAVIHQVIGDDELTSLFFSNGTVHQANGFNLQDPNGLAALQAVVSTLYGCWDYSQLVEEIPAQVKKRKTNKPIYFCFSPIGFFLKVIEDINIGYECYRLMVAHLKEKEQAEIIKTNHERQTQRSNGPGGSREAAGPAGQPVPFRPSGW